MWVSWSVDGCCRYKPCLYTNVHVLLHLALSGVFSMPRFQVLPNKVHGSTIICDSKDSEKQNVSGDPQQKNSAGAFRAALKTSGKNSENKSSRTHKSV